MTRPARANSPISCLTTPVLALQVLTSPAFLQVLVLVSLVLTARPLQCESLSEILFLWLNPSHNSGLYSTSNPPNRLSSYLKLSSPFSYPWLMYHIYPKFLSFIFIWGFFSPLHLLPWNIRSTISGICYVPFH